MTAFALFTLPCWQISISWLTLYSTHFTAPSIEYWRPNEHLEVHLPIAFISSYSFWWPPFLCFSHNNGIFSTLINNRTHFNGLQIHTRSPITVKISYSGFPTTIFQPQVRMCHVVGDLVVTRCATTCHVKIRTYVICLQNATQSYPCKTCTSSMTKQSQRVFQSLSISRRLLNELWFVTHGGRKIVYKNTSVRSLRLYLAAFCCFVIPYISNTKTIHMFIYSFISKS